MLTALSLQELVMDMDDVTILKSITRGDAHLGAGKTHNRSLTR